MHMNMKGEFIILIFNLILLVFQLTDCQPDTLNLSWATLDKHCGAGNGSLVRLNNSNNFESPKEFLLIRPMWPSIDGNFTHWITYLEGCYLECQKENMRCGQNKPIYFTFKRPNCFCVCKVREFLSRIRKCNESCYSEGECNTEKYITVYTEYVMNYKRSDGFCLVCSKANTNSVANLSAFDCDGEHFGLCVDREEICFGIKEDNGMNNNTFDCAQQLPFVCLQNNEMITNNQTSEVTSTTVDQSSKDTTPSVVHSSEVTSTTTVQSTKLSSKHPFEVPSSIPLPNSSTSFDKATMSSTDTVGAIVGLFLAVFALTSFVFLLWFYRKKGKQKLLDSQIDLQQPQTSQTVNNTYTNMMLVSGTNRNQNDVVFTTTTHDIQNDDIYDGEYNYLHSSRPKQVVSERDDERYATSTQLEDVSYSTVKKSRKPVPDRDYEYNSMTASLDNNCRSVANPDYDFCYQSSQRKDC